MASASALESAHLFNHSSGLSCFVLFSIPIKDAMTMRRTTRHKISFAVVPICCGIVVIWALFACRAQGVQFVNPQNLLNPATGLYDEFYVPPQLLRPDASYMAMIGGTPGTNPPPINGTGGQSAVVIAPDWILTAKHNVGVEGMNGKPVWINGARYKAVDVTVHPTADLAVARLVDWTNNTTPPPLPYVSIDPTLTSVIGAPITQGGYGRQFRRDDMGVLTGGYYSAPGLLTWSRNYITSNAETVSYSSSTTEELPFQGNGDILDSGGGYFLRDGWNWRLVANTTSYYYGASTTIADNYNWIDSIVGGLPAIQNVARPAASITWTAGYGDWNTASNWEDTSTHSARLPGLDATYYDTVDVKSTDTGPVISDAARAREVFVGGTSSGTYSVLSVTSGGALTATTLFIGGDVGNKGLISQYGGSITADTQYVGYRGAIGGFYQEGGTNNTIDLYVGKNNSGGLSFAVYEMAGSSNVNSRPILHARSIEIGGSAGANGQIFIGGGTGPYAEVQTIEQTVVGARGNGNVTQWHGTHDAGKTLILGQFASGIGGYSLTGGSLQSGQTQVGALGAGDQPQIPVPLVMKVWVRWTRLCCWSGGVG